MIEIRLLSVHGSESSQVFAYYINFQLGMKIPLNGELTSMVTRSPLVVFNLSCYIFCGAFAGVTH